MPAAVNALDRQILLLKPQGPSILSTDCRHLLQRYSLLAQLVGWNIKSLFEKAPSISNQDLGAAGIIRQKTTPEVLDHHSTRFALVRLKPFGSQTDHFLKS